MNNIKDEKSIIRKKQKIIRDKIFNNNPSHFDLSLFNKLFEKINLVRSKLGLKEIERYFSFNIDKNNKPIGPPTNLPATKGFTELKSTLFLSLINTRIANGKPNSDKS